ncbi:unnamed protein product, partial [Iphiclides podalirius]
MQLIRPGAIWTRGSGPTTSHSLAGASHRCMLRMRPAHWRTRAAAAERAARIPRRVHRDKCRPPPVSRQFSEMPQKDCAVQLSLIVQPAGRKLEVFLDVLMTSTVVRSDRVALASPRHD